MLLDGLQFTDTSGAVNFIVQSDTDLPVSGNNTGELFYKTGVDAGLYVYTGSAWVLTSSGGSSLTAGAGISIAGSTISAPYYDIALTTTGKPSASAKILNFAATRAFTVPANFANCVARCGTASGADAVFLIQKNTSQFGTLTFPNGSPSGTFSGSSEMSFAVGDVLRVIAPSTQDGQLSDISISFAASLV
jgi:hypothetical protein